MSVTAGDVMDGAAVLLSDPNKVTFGYAYQLPSLKLAWTELQEALVANGLSEVEETTSTVYDIAINTKEWTSGPTDLLAPIKLWERPDGGTAADFVPMEERIPDPSEPQVAELEVWYFSEGIIKFRGATTIREVQVQYQRELITISSEATVLTVPNVKSFLTYKTAEIICLSRGNKQRYAELQKLSTFFMDQVLSSKVRDGQEKPARQKRYGFSRRSA